MKIQKNPIKESLNRTKKHFGKLIGIYLLFGLITSPLWLINWVAILIYKVNPQTIGLYLSPLNFIYLILYGIFSYNIYHYIKLKEEKSAEEE